MSRLGQLALVYRKLTNLPGAREGGRRGLISNSRPRNAKAPLHGKGAAKRRALKSRSRHGLEAFQSAFAEIRKNCRGPCGANLLCGRASGQLFVRNTKTVITLAGARAEACKPECFEAGMYRTEASGHCLGSLNLFLPRRDDLLQCSRDSARKVNAPLLCAICMAIFINHLH